MDPHVNRLADVIRELRDDLDGELYDAQTLDGGDRVVSVQPGMKCVVEERIVNIVLFDVPGDRDHFSIVMVAYPKFSMTLREEARFDWALKTLGRVEDHQVGVPWFDRHYLIGGRPREDVEAYFARPEVEAWVKALGHFLNLAADTGFMRASFPLTPQSRYSKEDVRIRLVSLLRLAEVAEGRKPKPDAPGMELVPAEEF